MTDMTLKNLLGDDYEKSPNNNAVYLNGKLRYFNIDVDQPGKYFFDLTDAFNASVDEGNKAIPIRLNRGGEDINLNGYTISADGTYPDKQTPFHVGSSIISASPSYVRFNLPLGLFQAVGVYHFQFTFKNTSTGEILKSPWQFFNVTQSATNMALDLGNGIEPFDSEYTEWKTKAENQIASLSSTVGTLQSTVDTYTKTVNTAVDNAWNKKLSQENTWTSKQHFNGGITADNADITNLTVEEWFDAKKDLTVEQALHVKGNADLPSNVTFANPILKYESNNLAAGLFPCEGYWYADIAGGGKNNVACWGVNGVSGKYFSFRKFRYTARDGDTNSALMEIHADASIPTSAFGKPIIQFNNANLEGVDGTHFMFGGHELSFKASENALYCWGYAPGNSSDNGCNDSTMI